MCDKRRSAKSAKIDGGSLNQSAQSIESGIQPRCSPPSLLARYTCASVLVGIFAIWGKFTFVPESEIPGVDVPMHSHRVPLALTVGYLVSLPVLRYFVDVFLSGVDMKVLLKESMVLYNVGQVVLNGWMVYRFVSAVACGGHPFIGDISTVHSGTSFAVWVHYCDKYLEFLDTYFMVLRGKMDQVSFLHIYHHTTIAWAWWAGVSLYPGGDAYFGALLNSWIHVMMYSYYALSLLKIKCPWKKYLTMAQLVQFTSVVVYSMFSIMKVPTDEKDWRHYTANAIQDGEMISLFFLFSQFYKKSYGSKKRTQAPSTSSKQEQNGRTNAEVSEDDGDDQCQAAVAALASSTTEIIGSAAKEGNKIVASAKKTLSTTVVTKEVGDAMSRPSWSITQ